MATVIEAPIEEPVIDYRAGREAWVRQEEEYVERLAALARSRSKGALVGEVIKFTIADGYAEYVVAKEAPLTLWHIGLGDGYRILPATARGLRLGEVRAMVEYERRWAALLAEKRAAS